MRRGGEDATIRRWLEVAAVEPDPRWRADFALARTFADLTDRADAWYRALEGYNVIESRSVNLWKAEGMGLALRGLLEDRFGALPPDATAKIEQTTGLDVLQRWVILAAQAPSFDEFRKAAGL